MIPPLRGLLLAGGKSRRMGSDKAELAVHGEESLRDRGLRLLSDATDRSFLSIAADDTRSYTISTLRDSVADKGPLGGVLTALESEPGSAWLVVACDLPNLDGDTLAHLIACRDPEAEATAFLSDIDGIPEPLCAIYEPAAVAKLRGSVEAGKLCARHFIESLELHSVPLPAAGVLRNCNRPEDVEEIRLQAATGPVEKSLTLEFFAKLRDEAGCSTKDHVTRAATTAGLWDEVRLLHKFTIDLDAVLVAVNDEFARWDRPLADGDRIAFMPPFSGG